MQKREQAKLSGSTGGSAAPPAKRGRPLGSVNSNAAAAAAAAADSAAPSTLLGPSLQVHSAFAGQFQISLNTLTHEFIGVKSCKRKHLCAFSCLIFIGYYKILSFLVVSCTSYQPLSAGYVPILGHDQEVENQRAKQTCETQGFEIYNGQRCDFI